MVGGSWLRRRLARALDRLGLPGSQFVDGPYLYRNGATLFPKFLASNLTVAPDVELHGALFNLQDRIVIESGVVFGHEVMFLTGRHDVGPEGVDRGAETRGPILVKSGAWIASRAVILGGVTVGAGSVVAAGSVVTKSVPDGETWAGVPAKKIR